MGIRTGRECIRKSAQFDTGDIFQTDKRTIRIGPQDDISEFLSGFQLSAYVNVGRERFRAAPQRKRVRFVFGKHSGKRSVRLYVIAVYGKDIIAGLNAGFACRAF